MNSLLLYLILSFALLFTYISSGSTANTLNMNVYDVKFLSANEKDYINLSDYKGKVIVVVNTASLCGFVNQFSELQDLYNEYEHKGLVIIAIPSNDFGNQEPKSNKDVVTFCQTNFFITFPIASKIHVKGKDSDVFFQMTRSKFGSQSGPHWNFFKYIIDKDGNLVEWYSSLTNPSSKKFRKTIENLLSKDAL
jgi:glutathione peroxidase